MPSPERTSPGRAVGFAIVSKPDPSANAISAHPTSNPVERDAAAGTLASSTAVDRMRQEDVQGEPWTPEGSSPMSSRAIAVLAASSAAMPRHSRTTSAPASAVGRTWSFGRAVRVDVTEAELAANAKAFSESGMRPSPTMAHTASRLAREGAAESQCKVSADMTEAASAGATDAEAQAMDDVRDRAKGASSTARRGMAQVRATASRASRSERAARKAAQAYGKGRLERSAQLLAKSKHLSASRASNALQAASSAARAMSSKAMLWIGGSLAACALALCGLVALTGMLSIWQQSQAAGLEGNAQIVAAYLLEKGVDEMHVAAIMGCLSAETGDFDPTLGETASDAGGIGICQWPTNAAYGANPPGLRLKAYAAESGREWTDIFVQLDFMWMQISGEEAESAPGISAYASSDWGWAPYAACREWRASNDVSGPASWQGFLGTADILTACGYFTYGYLRPADWAAKIEVRCFGDDMGHTGAVAFWGALLQGSGGSEGTATAVARAYGEIGKPYLWGACGPDAFDCSGLVSYCLTGTYGMRVGTTETFMGWPQVDDPQPGDICTNSHHCGIYIGSGLMVHAPHTGDYVRIGAVHADMIYVRYQG